MSDDTLLVTLTSPGLPGKIEFTDQPWRNVSAFARIFCEAQAITLTVTMTYEDGSWVAGHFGADGIFVPSEDE